MRMCRLLFAFTLFLPAIASAWEESFPAVSKPWDEQQVLNFILAHSSVLRAYGGRDQGVHALNTNAART